MSIGLIGGPSDLPNLYPTIVGSGLMRKFAMVRMRSLVCRRFCHVMSWRIKRNYAGILRMGSIYNTPLNIPLSASRPPTRSSPQRGHVRWSGIPTPLVGRGANVLLASRDRNQSLESQHAIVWGLWLLMLWIDV